MTYVEIKTINGRKYKYLRKSIREGKKVRHITVKCLGAVDPIYKTGKARKTNASIYVRSLKKDEIKMLKKATKSNIAFTRDRAKILLLSSKGFFSGQIADKIGCESRKVRNAIEAFNTKGLKALERGKAKGAKPKFTKEQKAKMLMVASTEPQKLGMHFTNWSLPKLKKYFIEKEIVGSISIESIRQLLKSEGIKLKKSKRRQYSNDPDFAKKN
jgi:transposase